MDFVAILEKILVNPFLFPAYISLIIVFFGFMLWKFSKKLEDSVLSKIDSKFKEHEDKHKNLDFLENRQQEIIHIIENFEIIKKVIDLNKVENTTTIYKFIEYEFNDLDQRFNKNYNNGSNKDKALQELSICQQKLITMINKSMIKSNERRLFALLIEFCVEKISQLIEELVSLKAATAKLSLITMYFNNIRVLITFFSLKEINYASKSDEEIKEILSEDFQKLSNDIIVKKRSIIDEF